MDEIETIDLTISLCSLAVPDLIDLTDDDRVQASSPTTSYPSNPITLTMDGARSILRNKCVFFAGDESMRTHFRDLAQMLENGEQLQDSDVDSQQLDYKPIRGIG